MKKLLLLSFIIQISSCILAQSDTILYYRDYETEVIRDSSTWYRKIHFSDSARYECTVTDYYKNDQIKRTEGSCFATKNNQFYPNGQFTNYSKDGYKESEGTYVSDFPNNLWGKKKGTWINYDKLGRKKWEYFYEGVNKRDYDDEHVISFWDSTGKKLLSNGNGPLTFAGKATPGDGDLSDVTVSNNYKNGRLNGKSIIKFTANGKPFAEEEYDDGVLIKGISYDYARHKYTYTKLEENPEYPGGENELMSFLQKNIQYPSYERDNDIEGKVVLKFVVDKKGKVTNITVVRSVSKGLDNEAIRVVNLMPNFTPGKRKGQLVRVYHYLPVVYRLQ